MQRGLQACKLIHLLVCVVVINARYRAFEDEIFAIFLLLSDNGGQLLPVTPRRRCGAPTDASAVMTAHRLLSPTIN